MNKEIKVIAQNKKANHDYFIEETFEAGLVLTGTEIKSIRRGRINLKDSYCQTRRGEMFVYNMHISHFEEGNRFNHEPLRVRKLLLKKKQIASESELLTILEKYDVILPRKRNYFIESIYSHYQHAHHVKDLNCTREIISELHPEYITSFDAIMQGRKIHIYNMFVMSSEKASEYCEWLFPILFELERRIDITQYDSYQKRVFGFIAERLFNVWLVYHQLTFCEIPVVNLEGENLLKKAINLLKRKFLR